MVNNYIHVFSIYKLYMAYISSTKIFLSLQFISTIGQTEA